MKAATLRVAAVVLVGASALGGCFRATVRSGNPPGKVPDGYDARWHHGFIGGLIETSGPHDLAAICPEGWAEVDVDTDPLDGLLMLVTSDIYSPQNVTVVCRDEADAGSTDAGSTDAGSYPPPAAALPSADPF